MGHPDGEHRWARKVVPGLEVFQQVESGSMRRIQQRRPRRGYEYKGGRSKGVVSLIINEECVEKSSDHL